MAVVNVVNFQLQLTQYSLTHQSTLLELQALPSFSLVTSSLILPYLSPGVSQGRLLTSQI